MDIRELLQGKEKFIKSVTRRYEENLETEKELHRTLDRTGHLNGQGRFPVARMHFGSAQAGGTACEAIAVYNVLKDLGIPVTLSEVIREDELLGCMFLIGYFGTKIWKIGSMLSHFGVSYTRIPVKTFLRRAMTGDFEDGQMFVVTIQNDSRTPVGSLHTFELVYRDGRFVVYNRFNNSRTSITYDNLTDVLYNGKIRGVYTSVYMIHRDN